MGKMGKNTHMKSLAAPKTYPVRRARRGRVFVSRPSPGPHQLALSLPLCFILKDLLQVADTARESRKIVKVGKVLVDGKPVRDPNRAVGLMDVVSMAGSREAYRMLVNRKGRLVVVRVPETEVSLKPCRIVRKFVGKGGSTRITLHDGHELVMPPELAVVAPGDSALVELPSLKIGEIARLVEGSVGYCFKGRSAGLSGAVESVTESGFKKPSMVKLRPPEGEGIITVRDYVFVVGTNAPWISLGSGL